MVYLTGYGFPIWRGGPMHYAGEVADRVMFFDQGCIAHEAPPAEFFGNPASERIAAFIGRMGH
jgi:polar amino acid transport system ATP-binding protein